METINNEGLKIKYIITKADGSPVDPKAKYFVLRYDANMKDKVFLRASQKALGKFVIEIRDTFPMLSIELNDALQNEILKDS